MKKIKAWAVITTKTKYAIPIYNAGGLKNVPDVNVWAIFTTQKEAEKVLKISKKLRIGEADRFTKVKEIEISY